MAPKVPKYDDFVLTISDDDAPLPFEEEEDYGEPAANGHKRKRGREANQNGKKQKKGQKDNGTEADIGQKQDPRTRAEEDDGAMDSDFEFQHGDVDTGVVEDFDGWETKAPKNGEAKTVGDKKGVDIDEIIARRKAKNPKPDKANGGETLPKNEDSDVDDLDRADDESDSVNENEGLIAEESDDELMAPDGFGMGVNGIEREDQPIDIEEDEEDEGESDADSVATPVPHPEDEASGSSADEDDEEEKARRDAFFAPEPQTDRATVTKQQLSKTFQNMSLSRPILRGLAAVGFSDPTPIQAKTIPVALLGKDIVGGAVTGSGKTAAFMIPILERLLYRPKKVPTSRVVILMPTRELAVQCFNVAKKLASFTDVTFCQLVGGFSLREQESVLRTRPDVIVATPGRFIDHMRNSASFTVDTLEILVLDEADRMLEDGFADELDEILNTIPKSRQTMLFSATMTSSVDKLIRTGLNRPARLIVDSQKQTVSGLVQEFVRLRGNEERRLAVVIHLCKEIFSDRCIVFFRQKKEAHRVRIIFGLFGFKAGELHGSMTQEQRIASVESFRNGKVTHLLATDVASRGLDIKNVQSVVNYEAPQSHEIYLHRVGRTARAGRTGRAVTIAAEPDRRVIKAIVRSSKAQGAKIVSRSVDSNEIEAIQKKLQGMEEEVKEILVEEKEERALNQADMRIKKGENMIDHESEIMSRPRRTWFESEKDKLKAKARGKEELNGPIDAVKAKKAKLSNKDKKRLDDKRDRKEGKMWKKGKDDNAGIGKVVGKGGKRPQKGANKKSKAASKKSKGRR